MDLALSVSWNAFRHQKAKDLLFEIEELGFRKIELSFSLTGPLLDDLARELPASKIQVVSLHNYCPIPQGLKLEEALPDCFSMSSLDEDERLAAVTFTKRTIDTAARFGASAVVLHCGKVEMEDKTRALISLLEQGKKDTQEFVDLKDAALCEREQLAAPYFNNTLRSLDELNRYAGEKNIHLGVETRFYLREIPNLREIGVILEKFPDSRIHYWHDTGHAQVMQDLGVAQHRDFLALYGERLLGVHLHDVRNGRDHMAPSKGTFDFSWLKPYLGPRILKVIEAHHPASFQDIKDSKAFLEHIFHGAD